MGLHQSLGQWFLETRRRDGAQINGEQAKWQGRTRGCGRGISLTATKETIPNNADLENEIAENIFDWWISGKSYEDWYADKFQQGRLDLQ